MPVLDPDSVLLTGRDVVAVRDASQGTNAGTARESTKTCLIVYLVVSTATTV
jgi:hypothetical protein